MCIPGLDTGGGTVPGAVDDLAGGDAVPVTVGVVGAVHRKACLLSKNSNRTFWKATSKNSQ